MILSMGLAACASADAEVTRAITGPVYTGVETRLLQDDLVNFRVNVANASADDATRYADCAAAQYTLIRGYGFARHIRTQITPAADGSLTADAVYTISPALPRGPQTIDAEVVAASCGALGIPMV